MRVEGVGVKVEMEMEMEMLKSVFLTNDRIKFWSWFKYNMNMYVDGNSSLQTVLIYAFFICDMQKYSQSNERLKSVLYTTG